MAGSVGSQTSKPRRLVATVVAAAALVAGLLFAVEPAQALPASAAASAVPAATFAIPAATPVRGIPNLGPNVYVFTPSMPQAAIQRTVDAIGRQQEANQFGTQRYALLFEPGTYGTKADPLTFQVGYYTEVAGLGMSPADVVINGSVDVYDQCDGNTGGDCNALDNFWRSLSNVTINVAGGTGCRADTEFWAASQAAPMRRVQVNGTVTLMDYCGSGSHFSSGGFIADSVFTGGTIVNGSQQQYLVRDSVIDGWSNGVWNQVFSGVTGAPAQSFGQPGANPYTTLPTSPVTQEKPFLYTDARGALRVFVPAVRRRSSGVSWQSGPEAGTSVPISRFAIATPHTPVAAMNAALAAGRDLLLTPGVYGLDRAIVARRPGQVIIGLGFPTLVPQRGDAAVRLASAPGIKLSGVIIDAGPRTSRVLLQVGDGRGRSPAGDPALVQDVFFRIGGATAGRAADSLVVDSSHVILDDIWAWRADHGTGVGWTQNTANTGLIVNGDDVTAYGLFVEHYQRRDVVWNGQHGTVVFFQNEMPYDPPSQSAWQESRTVKGYPAFTVTRRVRTFQGYGMGSYSNFDRGVDIHATEGFDVPRTPGVQVHDVFTRFLNGSGGIDSVVDGTGAAVDATNPGPANVITYP